jgi:hypothetical protein
VPVAIAAEGIVELAIISLLIACLILRRAWVSTFGFLILRMAAPFEKVNWHFTVLGHGFSFGFAWVAKLLRGVNDLALSVLGAGIEANQWAALKLWHWTAYLIGVTGRSIGDLAESTYGELRHLARIIIPDAIEARVRAFVRQIEYVKHRLEHLDVNPTTIIHKTVRVIDPRVAHLERDVHALAAKLAAAGSAVIPAGVAIPAPDVTGIRHGLDAARAKLGQVARTLTPAGILGLTAAAVFRFRLGWLKCGNVRRTGENLCRMDGGLLDDLLAGTLLVFGTVSLVEFAREMETLMEEITPAVVGFWQD